MSAVENKTQEENKQQDRTDSESPKKENTNNNTDESPPVKRNNNGKIKSTTAEITILSPSSIQQQTNVFFELFYDGPYDMTITNRSWGIHRVPPPNRAIVLSEITFALSNASMSPSYIKQIILADNLKFKAFVLDKLVVEKTLDGDNTQEDFEQSFAEIANMIVCKGGPHIGDNQDVLTRCAHKDFYSNRWRHKSCTIILEKGEEVCRPCLYIDKYFQEWKKYSSTDK